MGRTAQIGRAGILAAALEIADDQGLDAVTMHAVAQRLEVTTMALYRHVANKAALMDGLVEVLITEFPLPAPGSAWHERLTAMATGVRATARRHPGAFALLLGRPTVTPAALTVRHTVHEALREAGIPDADVARTERLLATVVFGFAISEATGRFRHHDQAVIDEDFAELLRWLRRILPAPQVRESGKT
jgi:AcrR family transcriptional regulator